MKITKMSVQFNSDTSTKNYSVWWDNNFWLSYLKFPMTKENANTHVDMFYIFEVFQIW